MLSQSLSVGEQQWTWKKQSKIVNEPYIGPYIYIYEPYIGAHNFRFHNLHHNTRILGLYQLCYK